MGTKPVINEKSAKLFAQTKDLITDVAAMHPNDSEEGPGDFVLVAQVVLMSNMALCNEIAALRKTIEEGRKED
jgi:hypothetical protein